MIDDFFSFFLFFKGLHILLVQGVYLFCFCFFPCSCFCTFFVQCFIHVWVLLVCCIFYCLKMDISSTYISAIYILVVLCLLDDFTLFTSYLVTACRLFAHCLPIACTLLTSCILLTYCMNIDCMIIDNYCFHTAKLTVYSLLARRLINAFTLLIHYLLTVLTLLNSLLSHC